MAGIAVVVYLSEKKNRDCATSFLEIYVQLYDFEEFCRRMKQNRIKSKYLRNVDFTELLICRNVRGGNYIGWSV